VASFPNWWALIPASWTRYWAQEGPPAWEEGLLARQHQQRLFLLDQTQQTRSRLPPPARLPFRRINPLQECLRHLVETILCRQTGNLLLRPRVSTRGDHPTSLPRHLGVSPGTMPAKTRLQQAGVTMRIAYLLGLGTAQPGQVLSRGSGTGARPKLLLRRRRRNHLHPLRSHPLKSHPLRSTCLIGGVRLWILFGLRAVPLWIASLYQHP
jgi:hypothetical protein